MEEKRQMYILLEDRRGERTERGLLHLKSKSVETQFIRGQIFRTLPETEQPEDSNKIALVETTSENFKLVCATTEVARITEEEAKLLSAIVSAEERHRIFRERNRLGFGIAIKNGTKVLVKVKTAGGVHRDVPGVVWFKGPLPTHDGTMFGVELTPNKPK